MKIKNWLIRGDCHGQFDWIKKQLDNYQPEETAIIILGDAGFDFYLNKTDIHKKEYVEAFGYYIYCVHGNHEERACHIAGNILEYDDAVEGFVWYNPDYPHIRFFRDYDIYNINGYSVLVIGGAYSIDKEWRLMRAGYINELDNNPKKSGWFNTEQLTQEERKDCLDMIDEFNNNCGMFDFIFSHTCPKRYQPTDLFLNGIDQSKVDNSMEEFLNIVDDKAYWYIWCFGHYHADRIEQPFVEQYFNDIEELDAIMNRWSHFDETHELPWYIVKSPNFNEKNI